MVVLRPGKGLRLWLGALWIPLGKNEEPLGPDGRNRLKDSPGARRTAYLDEYRVEGIYHKETE